MTPPLPTAAGPWLRRGLLAGAVLVLFTALAAFDIAQTYFLLHFAVPGGPDVPLSALVGRGLAEWYLWALMTPGLVWLARRFPLDGTHWLRNLALQGGVSAAVSVVQMVLYLPFIYLFNCGVGVDMEPWDLFKLLFFKAFLIYLIICGVILGATHAVAYYRKYRERELQASQLAAQLAQTQLQVLKMQLHPHFLFNTLHAISALMHKDVELADRMIARLGELLRSTLENAGLQEVALRQ